MCKTWKDSHVDRRRFDADADPGLDRHQQINLDLDPNRHRHDAAGSQGRIRNTDFHLMQNSFPK